MTKQNILLGLGAVIVLGLIWGAYLYPKVVEQQVVAGSSAGTNFNSAKIAEQTVTVSTTTVYSQLNTDSSNRTILAGEAFFTGGTSTSTDYSFVCATSSVSTGLAANANQVLAFTIGHNASVFGTTSGSGVAYVATSSPGIMGSSSPSSIAINPYVNTFGRVWPSGSYLVCIGSGSGAANGGLIDSSVTGYISFPYRAN